MQKIVVAIEVDGNAPVLSFFKAGSDDPIGWECIDRKTRNGIADALAGLVDEHEVNAPGVDTDGVDGDVFVNGLLDGCNYLIVKGREIPEEMSSERNHRVLEAGELPHVNLLAVVGSDYRPSAGGSEIYRKVIFDGHNGYKLCYRVSLQRYFIFVLYTLFL